MIFEIFLSLLIILLCLDYFKKIRMNKFLETNGVMGPKLTLPLIGDILLTRGLNLKNVEKAAENFQRKFGKVYRLWSFNKCILLIQDVEYVKSILSSSKIIKKAIFYEQLRLWLGDGLVMSSGIKWQQRRKIFTATFHIKMLEQFVQVFDQQAHVMVEKLQKKADGLSIIDLDPVISSITLDTILETAMGIKLNAENSDCLAYMEALKNVTQIAVERFINPLKHNDFMFKLMFYKSYRVLQESVETLHVFAEKVIKKRREELLQSKTNETEDDEMALKKRFTLLDVLLQAQIDGKPLTNEDIREEVDTFIFGGHDTVTCAISYILYIISRHPKEQQKVYDEILEILGSDKNKPINIKELQELKYLDCVINEAMRLYPPIPLIGRIAEEDFRFGNKIIPRKTNIIIIIVAMLRDPDYFPKPNDFIPERFTLANKENINQYAFVPFSAGPRSCIGQKYAILEIKTIVSCVVRHFELLPLGPEADRIISLVMRSSTGVNVGLKHRA